MRVLFVVPKYPPPVVGGLEKQARQLADELSKLDVKVTCLSGRFRKHRSCNTSPLEGPKIIRPWWLSYDETPGGRVKSWSRLLSIFLLPWLLLRSQSYDVVHIHSNASQTYFVQMICHIRKWPVIRKMPNVGVRGVGGLKKRLMWPFYRSILRHSNLLIALNQEGIQDLLAVGVEESRIKLIPNGIAVSRTSVARKTIFNRRRVIFLGRITRHKGIFILLSAWKQFFRNSNPSGVFLCLAGDGPDRVPAEQWVKANGLEGSVEFLGRVADPYPLLCESDVFVLPSFGEGQSNAILEAMATGLPIIASNLTSIRDQVGEADDRFFHQPGDAAGLASCLELFYREPAIFYRWGSSLQERVEMVFDMREVAKRYIAQYVALSERVPTQLKDDS